MSAIEHILQRPASGTLSRTALSGLHPLTTALVLIVSVFAIFNQIVLPPHQARAVIVVDVALVVTFLLLRHAVKSWEPPTRLANGTAFGICMALLAGVLYKLHLLQNASLSAYPLILLLATGFFMLSLKWLSAAVVCIWLGWLLVAAPIASTPELLHLSLAFFAATVLAVIIHRIRTDQVKTLITLERSEQRFRSLFEHSPDAMFVEDLEGVILDVNPAACELHDMPRAQLVGKRATDLTPPGSRAESERIFRKLASGELKRAEGVSVTSHQEEILVELRVKRIDYAGRPALLTTARDITERRQAEQRLRRSEERFRKFANTVQDGILFHVDGEIVDVNDTLVELIGWSRTDLLGMQVLDLILPADRDQARAGIAGGELLSQRLNGLRKDGSTVPLEVTVKEIASEGRLLRVIITRDVSAQRELELQLHQAQKMEAVGRLAGGIAHDFNNLMTAVTGYSELALETLETDHPIRAELGEILKAGERAVSLTRQLLAFSRQQVLRPRLLDLNTEIRELEKLLRRTIGEHIELDTNLAGDLGMVRADPGQIDQILLNLAVNARDAIDSGGRITIATANVDLDAAYGRAHAKVQPGAYVMFSVTDTGCGFDEATLNRIFEPFFTTKERGKGTGLGLSTVYGIVKQSGGYIWAYSEPGQGATFKIYLPRVDETGDVATTPGASPESLHGSETILLVEDDRDVRHLTERILSGGGYRVLSAAHPEEALDISANCGEPVHLLLTDLVMPSMTGVELADRLLAVNPELQVLYMSGYAANTELLRDRIQEDTLFLEKPFMRGRLLSQVRRALSEGET